MMTDGGDCPHSKRNSENTWTPRTRGPTDGGDCPHGKRNSENTWRAHGIQELARKHTIEALDVLVQIMLNGKSPPNARVAAWDVLRSAKPVSALFRCQVSLYRDRLA